ncbi:type II secretion system minor pseudopilin GspI [Vibrio sp. RC27]
MNKHRGMTLLEVMLALAIFATASLSVIKAVSQQVDSISYMEEKSFASWVADNQIALVMLSGATVETKSGKEELAGVTWYWTLKPVETESSLLAAFDVEVSRKEGGEPLISVRTYQEPQ